MSKTVENQIEKCRLFIEKTQGRMSEAAERGITADELETLGRNIETLGKMSKACDELHQCLSEQIKSTNSLLAEVKDCYTEAKKKIKAYYPQERWQEFGVPDKR